MAGDEKSYVMACAWTLQQTPEVENEEQAESYRRNFKALIEQWRTEGELTHEDFMRSRAGILAQTYRARIDDWEGVQLARST